MIKIIIISVIILGFILLAIKLIEKEKIKDKKFDDMVKDIKSRCKFVLKIKESPSFKYKGSNLSSSFLKLKELSHIFTYFESENEFWIAFVLINNTEQKLTWGIGSVLINIDGNEYTNTETLLLEKVPEFQSPPYGNRYIQTKGLNSLTLGSDGQIFRLQSSFPLPNTANRIISENDNIKITINIYANPNDKTPIEKIEFFEYFKYIKFQTVQSFDEKIEVINLIDDSK